MTDDPFERAVAHADQEREERKREQSARGNQLGFRIHLTAYLFVQVLLVAIWAIDGDSEPWFVYPLLGWGVGLAAHYLAVRDTWRRRAPGPG